MVFLDLCEVLAAFGQTPGFGRLQQNLGRSYPKFEPQLQRSCFGISRRDNSFQIHGADSHAVDALHHCEFFSPPAFSCSCERDCGLSRSKGGSQRKCKPNREGMRNIYLLFFCCSLPLPKNDKKCRGDGWRWFWNVPEPFEVAATLADAIEDAKSNVWSARAAAMDANSLVGWGWTWTVE